MSVNADRARLYAALQASTAEMLGFKNPTPTQQLKIDLAASLRMEIDRIVSLQLAGNEINLRDLTNASEALANLLRSDAGAAAHSYTSGARAKLAQLIECAVAAADHDTVPDADILRREEMAAVAAALPTPPAITASEQTNNEQTNNTRATYIDADVISPLRTQSLHTVNAVPPHYLRDGQPREPWRDHIDDAGNIMTRRGF